MPDNLHVVINNIVKSYSDQNPPAVDNVSMEIRNGELLTLLGPSGSGKTTLLHIIAGFLAPTTGSLSIAGRDVTKLPPHKRDIGMVFQNYALFPHMSVAQNIEFPLKQRKIPKGERAKKIRTMLEMVRLEGKANSQPSQLSGGQQQRVALARALAFDPDLLLMDEPLGALDKTLRGELQQEIRRLHKVVGKTLVFVTHDQEEALALSDRIAVFNEGKVDQIGTAQEVYEKPVSLFSANFLGESTIIHGERRARGRILNTATGKFRLTDQLPDKQDEASLVIRPEHAKVVSRDHGESYPAGIQDDEDFVAAAITDVAYQGSTRKIYVTLNNHGRGVVLETFDSYTDTVPGDPVFLKWNINNTWLV